MGMNRETTKARIATKLWDAFDSARAEECDFRACKVLLKAVAEVPSNYVADLSAFRKALTETVLIAADDLGDGNISGPDGSLRSAEQELLKL